KPENIVPYQAGKAAKVAPPATTSHVSFPSQTGPIVSSIVFRSSSSRGTNGSNMPTPKSKPSSRKEPAQSTPMRRNQNSWRSIREPSSVAERGNRAVLFELELRRVEAREVSHEDEVDDGEDPVEGREHSQAEPDRRRSHAGRVRVGRLQQPLHDP